jgi:hypothetical protein
VSNGNGFRLPGVGDAVRAAMAQQQQLQPRQVSEGELHETIAKYLGLSPLQWTALKANVVPCMCGQCQGVGIQFESRWHFTKEGGLEGIVRGDAVKRPEPTTDEKGKPVQ